MDIDSKLNQLKQIQEVEAPPFLLTRIHQQIKSLNDKPAPAKWKLAFAICTALILSLNLSIIFSKTDTNPLSVAEIDVVVNSMTLSNSNELYHE